MNSQHNPHPRVAVIGAGIAGLAAAYELQQQGIDVRVYERDQFAGGRMITKQIDGLQFDAGALFFSDNYTQMKAYAAAFDIPWIPYERHCAQRFMRNGKTQILHMRGLQDILRQPLLSWSARTALIRWLMQVRTMKTELDFFDLSTLPADLDMCTAEEYLRTYVHDEINDYISDPFTGAMQFHRTDELSAGAMIALLQMTMSQTRKFTPRYTVGGISRIAQALAERVPATYGINIQSIRSTNGGATVIFNDGNQLTFDAIVCATPAYIAASLLKHATDAQQQVFDEAKYAATITIALKVPANIADGSHCTYVPYKEHQLISSYTFEENKHSAFTNNHQAVMNVYLREEAARQLLQSTDEEIYRQVISQMLIICPELRGRELEITGLATHRWQYAMPKFNHRYISTVRNFVMHHQGEGNIFLAGDYLNSPWTEGAARSGIRAGKAVSESLNRSGYTIGSAAISSSSVGAVLPL